MFHTVTIANNHAKKDLVFFVPATDIVLDTQDTRYLRIRGGFSAPNAPADAPKQTKSYTVVYGNSENAVKVPAPALVGDITDITGVNPEMEINQKSRVMDYHQFLKNTGY